MLIDVYSMLRVGDTPVALIFTSDKTHVPDSAGDRKECPVYTTIDNLSSIIRQMLSTHSVAMVALLQIALTNCNIPQTRRDEDRHTNSEVLNEVLRQVLQPHTCKQNPGTKSRYYNCLRANGNFRSCKPVFAASFADGHGSSNLHHFEQHVCFWC